LNNLENPMPPSCPISAPVTTRTPRTRCKTLHAASVEECRILLAQGVDVNLRDADGQTAMHWAAEVNDIEKIRLLFSAGADPNLSAEPVCNRMTPLHTAAFDATPETIQALLDAGCDRMALDDEGHTPYEIALHFRGNDDAAVLNLLKPTRDDGRRRAEHCAHAIAAAIAIPPSRRVFDSAPALALAQELGATPDTRSLVPLLQRALRKRGELTVGHRAVALSPSRDALQGLRNDFPNFVEVIDLIERRCALSTFADGAFELPPILLVGPPGVGKTCFVKKLADVAQVPFHDIPMATASTGWMLSGLDRSWHGAKPGRLFRALCVDEDAVANPLFLLDEIDKVSGSAGNSNASRADAALYALLEPTSAARFEDECLPVTLDARSLVIVATANDLESIPAPLRSRFEVFHIQPAAQDERQAIARSVHANLCASNPWGKAFADALDEDVLDALVREHADARSMRRALTDACAAAALRGEKHVRISDVPRTQEPQRRTMGFV